MIEARDLTKHYGPVEAVRGVSFAVPAGAVWGFLGPNGAGKSTTMRMLCGLLPPTSGVATLAGVEVWADPAAARAKLGYLPESNPLYPEMRVTEYLHFLGRVYAMPRRTRVRRVEEVVQRCGLPGVRRRTIGRLSKGNRQRVGLAGALLHEPAVLVLDEPTSGLDPAQVVEVRALIRELAGKHTVLLSTHQLEEVRRVADAAVVIAAGRVVASGPWGRLEEQAGGAGDVVVEAKGDVATLRGIVGAVPGVQRVVVDGSTEPLRGPAELLRSSGAPPAEPLRGSGASGARAPEPRSGSVEAWVRLRIVPRTSTHDLREPLAAALQRANVPLRELARAGAGLEAWFVRITDAARAGRDQPADTTTGAAR